MTRSPHRNVSWWRWLSWLASGLHSMRFLWLMHAKFICGITGVVRDDHGRVLLLRHRLLPPGRQWSFPTGYANKGERHEDTIAREVREETGLTVKSGRLDLRAAR